MPAGGPPHDILGGWNAGRGGRRTILFLVCSFVQVTYVAEAADISRALMAELLMVRPDRYGGVEVDVTETAGAMLPAEFDLVLRKACADWAAQGKKGVWLKVPLASGSAVGAAAANGFVFHHAQPTYAMMTRWLPPIPSTLPNYSFTQIGVGGVVRVGPRPESASAGMRGGTD
jgi:hypothetical protein